MTIINLDGKIDLQKKENDVLAIGELLIDMITSEYNNHFKSNTYNKFYGGAPANIAINLKNMGINSLVASAIGDDDLGKFLIKKIQDAGLDTSYIQQVEHPTSMVLITKSKSSPAPIFYQKADRYLTYTLKLEEALKKSKIVHFSCWSLSKLPARQTIERVIEEAGKNNSLIGFDPNYHPSLWKEGEDAVEYIKSIISYVDVIKPSEVDAERLFGKDTHENQIEKFLKLGVRLVIMTLGKDGAIVSNGVETIQLNSLATEVVDTTGAGDAFWSGFYAALVKGYTVRQSLSIGFAVSAYKLKYTGAVVDLPNLEEIKELYNL